MATWLFEEKKCLELIVGAKLPFDEGHTKGPPDSLSLTSTLRSKQTKTRQLRETSHVCALRDTLSLKGTQHP